jgi:RNA-directed DNA polymerase
MEVPVATPIGDVRDRWLWTESAAWTDRMLTALERGAKGGVWYSLIDKVWSVSNLQASWAHVAANGGAAGVDRVTIDRFGVRLESELGKLSQELRNGTYRPQAVRRAWIDKPGSSEKRPLGIPTVRDRIVQGAVRHVLEPIFEKEFAEHSYGFRPGRGCKDALRRVEQLVGEHVYIVDADLKGYFDSIPHERLIERVRERVTDGRMLALVESFLKAQILDDLKRWTPEAGAPQGAVLSPLLSNIYLNPLDHLMASRGFEMVRYADDFVILCRTREEAEQALELVKEWVAENGLVLHPVKTKIADARTDGFDFLGYHFCGKNRWPRKKSEEKLKATVHRKTLRTDGRSLSVIIADLNVTLRGWFEYFKHSAYWTFPPIDGWIRARLRAILRKRTNRRGHARNPADHKRWDNELFAELGLYGLTAAQAEARRSSRR